MPKIIQQIEQVILVDSDNTTIGTADKATVHSAHTPLHLAFSVFVFNKHNEVLLQQRAYTKITWPGIWSNSCCGHPRPNESLKSAVKRRLQEELNLDVLTKEIKLILPNYQYRAEYLGVVEHEICPVFVVRTSLAPQANPNEVNDTVWIPWHEFVNQMKSNNDYSPWCIEETQLLNESTRFNLFLSQ